jgi:hypothetical protein
MIRWWPEKIQDTMDVAKIRVQKIIRQGPAAALRATAGETKTMAKADTVKTETEATATVRTAEGEATVKAEKTMEIMAEPMTRTPIAEARAMAEAGKTDHHRLRQSHQAATTGEAEDAVAQPDRGRMAITLHLSLATYMARPCRLTTQGTTSTAIRKRCSTTTGQSVLVQQSGLLRRRQDSKSASTSSAMTEQRSQICGWRTTTRR